MIKKSPILYVLKFFLQENPSYLLVVFFEKILWSILFVYNSVYLLKILFDYIQNKMDLIKIINIIIMTAILCLIVYLVNVFVNFIYKPKIEAKLSEKIKLLIYKKYIDLPLFQFESEKIEDNYFLILADSPSRFFSVVDDIANLISQIISMIFIMKIMASIDFFTFFVMIPPSILFFYIKFKKNKILFEKDMAIIKQNKEKEYLNRLFYLPQYAKEIRCTNISNAAFYKIHFCYRNLREKVIIFGKKLTIIEIILYFTTSLFFEVFLLLYSTLRLIVYETFTIGDYIAIINSGWKLYENINTIFDSFAKFKLHSEYLKKYIDFINLVPLKNIEGKKPGKFESLCLNKVSFSYGNSKRIINSISLKIIAGQKIALVGSNGAGKTTLMKLIMGLYPVNTGKITYNNIEYSQYAADELIHKFRLVSQDNNLYAISFAENIFMNSYNKDFRKNYDLICQKAGLNELIQTHAIKPESNMTLEFSKNGIALSGGETQLVNISRMFSYPLADIYILDEPSSALDALKENFINEILMSFDKTLIIATHKLGIAKHFDKIYFIENGNIVESGNHSSLMKKRGKYYALFNSQK